MVGEVERRCWLRVCSIALKSKAFRVGCDVEEEWMEGRKERSGGLAAQLEPRDGKGHVYGGEQARTASRASLRLREQSTSHNFLVN